MSELPPGFVLDHTEAAIPAGFTLDQPSIGEDAAKSIGAGLGNLTISTLGMPGDLSNLLSHGSKAAADYIANKMGYESSPPVGKSILPTSQDLRNTVTDPIVSPDYKPQYPLGDVLKTGAEFLPAMIGGPESLATRALTRVAAPAVASVAAGKLTEGTAAQPYAELAAALAGGVGASAAANKFKAIAAARTAAKATPSAEDLLSTAGKQFEDVKASDAIINPASVEQMAKDIRTELLNDGKHPTLGNQNGVFSALDRLENLGQQGGGVTPKDMETIRKNLITAKMDIDGGTRAAAKQAADSFMTKYSNLGQGDLLNGSNPFPILKDAIGNYAAGKRSNTVMGKAALADLNSATAGSGANQDNAMRQAIKQLVRPVNNDIVPKAARMGFNQAEIDAMNTAARGTALGNTARFIGKGAPTGIVSAAGGFGVGHMAGGPIGAVALPAVGYVAKKIGDLSTKRAVQAIDSLVRSRSPLAAQVAAQLPPQIIQQLPAKSQRLLQALVLANPSLPKQPGQPVGQTTP